MNSIFVSLCLGEVMRQDAFTNYFSFGRFVSRGIAARRAAHFQES
jgi:hypothetical protein